MTTHDLAAIVDLERYPIHDLESEAGQALLARVRGELREVGACDLRGFLREEAIDASVASALAVRDQAFRTQSGHDIEFSGVDPATRAEGDPLRVQVRSAKEGTAYDRVPADNPARLLYESDALLRFVGAALEVEPIYRQDDPLGAFNLMYYAPGDELGWHFDNSHFVVTVLLQAPAAGGTFEFVPMLRTEDDRNDAGVASLLAGTYPGVRTMSGEPGTLALFRGHWSPHRVTPVEGDRVRVNAVLSFANRPGAHLSAEAYRLFYGRVPATA